MTYFTMGINKWQTADTWPPAGAKPTTFYLSSGGKANTMDSDGALGSATPAVDTPDAFAYDPMHPVTSYGGNVCCTGTAITAGAFDQRKVEMRPDVLVYTSEPFKTGVEISGPIMPTLYVSSDAKDTDSVDYSISKGIADKKEHRAAFGSVPRRRSAPASCPRGTGDAMPAFACA